jgi:hypothetical protein
VGDLLDVAAHVVVVVVGLLHTHFQVRHWVLLILVLENVPAGVYVCRGGGGAAAHTFPAAARGYVRLPLACCAVAFRVGCFWLLHTCCQVRRWCDGIVLWWLAYCCCRSCDL